MKRIILKAGEEDRILAGHPWVYDNEVAKVLGPSGKEAVLEPGELAEVETQFGQGGRSRYLGRAFANPRSKIIARIYSPSKEGVDKGFFKRRIREAIGRRLLGGGSDEGTYNLAREPARLVFGEADFLPGLIIDRFVGWPLAEIEENLPERPLDYDDTEGRLGPPDSWIALQFLSFGMEKRREEIITALEEVLSKPLSPALGKTLGQPRGIIERSAPRIRELEGLPPGEGPIKGIFPPGGIVIFENGLPFAIDPEGGQKTGHFLDQRDNRLRAAACTAQLAESSVSAPAVLPSDRDGVQGAGLRILDGCCCAGGFAIHILRLGDYRFNAGEGAVPIFADCVDSSTSALEALKVNAALNGVEDQVRTVEADIFDFLREAERRRAVYDLVILDPPAFAKTRSALEAAIRGYKEINLRAIKLLRPGGILISCSCSQCLEEGRFSRIIAEAAADAERRLYLLESRSQAPDHPVLVGYDESRYLKCHIYRVM
ncbi:MAG: class I SAM-dependent rRNA methyltransferase [Treponema sp.]|jgi:23S rRNA (cytosine1962-C5)-methyltransferase|nr:class I SAM-dependent rRNA methyltransferase [Treponema sp.]